MKQRKIISVIFFGLFVLVALHIPFSNLLGANVQFTLFDFTAPTLGIFLGTFTGMTVAVSAQLLNLLFMRTPLSVASILRLFPTLFAIYYFSKNKKRNMLVPILSIVLFNLHPIGRSAWQYSLLWLIPIVSQFMRKNVFLKSLGATFTAHAVGGVLWVWTFGLTRQIWLALIPQVLIERMLMALGITASYLILSYLLYPAHILRKSTKKLFPKHSL